MNGLEPLLDLIDQLPAHEHAGAIEQLINALISRQEHHIARLDEDRAEAVRIIADLRSVALEPSTTPVNTSDIMFEECARMDSEEHPDFIPFGTDQEPPGDYVIGYDRHGRFGWIRPKSEAELALKAQYEAGYQRGRREPLKETALEQVERAEQTGCNRIAEIVGKMPCEFAPKSLEALRRLDEALESGPTLADTMQKLGYSNTPPQTPTEAAHKDLGHHKERDWMEGRIWTSDRT